MNAIETYYNKTQNPQKDEYKLHIHENCEIYCFIGGNASYFVEGTIYPLNKGDIIITRHAESHRLILNSNATYERMVINFPISLIKDIDCDENIYSLFYNRSIGKYNHFPVTMFPEQMWFYYVKRIYEVKEQKRKLIFLYALLDELAEKHKLLKSFSNNAKIDKISEIIQYIDNHLFDEICIDTICKHSYISRAQLNRIFKNNTGFSVWDYISSKRLTHAKELLQQGIHPTKIPEQCGYTNYVTFYKAYKKSYNSSPMESFIKK